MGKMRENAIFIKKNNTMKNILNYESATTLNEELNIVTKMFIGDQVLETNSEGYYIYDDVKLPGAGTYGALENDTRDQDGNWPGYSVDLDDTPVVFTSGTEVYTCYTATFLEGPYAGVSGIANFPDWRWNFFTGTSTSNMEYAYAKVLPPAEEREVAIDPNFIATPVPGVALAKDTGDVYYNPFGYPIYDTRGPVAAYFETKNVILTPDLLLKMQSGFDEHGRTRDAFMLEIPEECVDNVSFIAPVPEEYTLVLRAGKWDDGIWHISFDLRANPEDYLQIPGLMINFNADEFDAKEIKITGHVEEGQE